MESVAEELSITPSEEQLAPIRALYAHGLCVQAVREAETIAPLAMWRGASPRILAGRIAANVGAARLHQRHHLLAYREERADPIARYFYARLILERRGPFFAWQTLQRLGESHEAAPEIRAEWLAYEASILGILRDFDRAQETLERAQQLDPSNPWICVERAGILETEDRHAEALEVAQHALQLRAWYRPAVQQAAHLLETLERPREAMQLLQEADTHIESAPLASQTAILAFALGEYSMANAALDRFEVLAVLLEDESRTWVLSLRSDIAYKQGRFADAIRWARESKNPFHETILPRLEAAQGNGDKSAPVVELAVPYVQQHHQTCAPATLTAISRFWSRPADHVEVAEAICYDGTSNYNERHWAQQNGFVAREFTLTWGAARVLLDRGAPFTLVTVQTASAHLQAVAGYDARRGTLLIRDPNYSALAEANAEKILEQQASVGPRAMVMIPIERASLLDEAELPDAELYDILFRLNDALENHRRDEAVAAREEMSTRAPDHRLTIFARRAVAAYDGDDTELLRCVEELLEKYPDDANLQMERLARIQDASRRDERLSWLQEICAKKECDPIFWMALARELESDAREHKAATLWMKRVLRARPLDADAMWSLAGLLWNTPSQGSTHDVSTPEEDRTDHRVYTLELYRLAACLAQTNERFANSYFIAARHFHQTPVALQWLENRFARFGSKSSWPARTLFHALDDIDDAPRAFKVLDEARALRPEDGELALFAAQAHARYGQFEKAEAALNAAQGHAPPGAWQRVAAHLAWQDGDNEKSLALWRDVLAREPLALDAHEAIVDLLSQAEGDEAAKTHLLASLERFPHHLGLRSQHARWLREHESENHQDTEAALRDLLERSPSDGWARRELALLLAEVRRYDEAKTEIETAIALRPRESYNHSMRGEVLARAGEIEAGKESFRAAVRLSADNGYAISRLLWLCDTNAQAREELRFVESELARQTVFGEGLTAFATDAATHLDAGELLTSLRKALAARPDLWQAWSVVINQLIDADQLDEALSKAEEGTQRFPLLPAAWLDLAAVHSARPDPIAQRAALQEALRINPRYSAAIRALCASYERESNYAKSREILEAATAREPRDATLRAWLAEAQWRTGEKENAVQSLRQVLQWEPGIGWAWDALRDYGDQLGRPNESIELARDLAKRRPGEARSHLMLARVLSTPDAQGEQLAALDKALELNPRLFEACDLKAQFLAEAERYDEAKAACLPPGWTDDQSLPVNLRGRRSWIEAQRGDLEAAIAEMQRAVADEPNYQWGWLQLVKWFEATGQHFACVEAARELVRLAPHDPASHGYLADALLRDTRRTEAKAELQRALELAPKYAFAAGTLLDLQIEDNELDEATRTLEILQTHTGGPWSLESGVRLGIARREEILIEKNLSALCLFTPDENEPHSNRNAANGAIDAAVEALKKAGFESLLSRVLDEVITSPQLLPQSAGWWGKICVIRKEKFFKNKKSEAERLARGLSILTGEARAEALAGYAEVLADANRKSDLLKFINTRRDELRAHPWSWGIIGWLLYRSDESTRAQEWLSDWQTREGVQSWMLINLVLSLRHRAYETDAMGTMTQLLEQSRAAGRAALELPADHCANMHRIWLTFDAALEGQVEEASTLLAATGNAKQQPYYEFLSALTMVLIALQSDASEEASTRFMRAKAGLQEARRLYPKYQDYSTSRWAYRQTVKKIGALCGGWWPRLWAFFVATQ